MNWSNYTDIYDLYINGKKVRRIWGLKHAIKVAESQSGNLFEEQAVWLVNIHTGLEIYNNKKGGVNKN